MYTTVNGSRCSFLPNAKAEKVGGTFAFCLILVVSLVGNSFIGIIVYKTQTLRKPINYFITNMAISDLVFPIFLVPWIIVLCVDSWLISGPVDQFLCKLVTFFSLASNIVSAQSLVLIAVDRFGAVVFPLRSPLISSKLCPFFILATWIIAMAVCSPYLIAFKLPEYADDKVRLCVRLWYEATGESLSYANYSSALIVVFLYVPIALLVTLYSVIVIKLKTQKIPGEQPVNAVQQRVKRTRNVLKMAIAIVLGFVLCWTPWSIFTLLSMFARDLPCSFYSIYYPIVYCLSASNCAINPCICFSLSQNYRQGLKRLLKCFNGVQDRVN